jgi:hypothetical protein
VLHANPIKQKYPTGKTTLRKIKIKNKIKTNQATP